MAWAAKLAANPAADWHFHKMRRKFVQAQRLRDRTGVAHAGQQILLADENLSGHEPGPPAGRGTEKIGNGRPVRGLGTDPRRARSSREVHSRAACPLE